MKFHTEYLTFNTQQHRDYVHITPQVEAILRNSGIKEGMVLVSAMHITAAIYVNDHEDGLIHDIDEWLEKLAPYRRDYKHHQTGEDNGDSHLKSLLIHHGEGRYSSNVLRITGGPLYWPTISSSLGQVKLAPVRKALNLGEEGTRKRSTTVRLMPSPVPVRQQLSLNTSSNNCCSSN
jgi:secondary thiamine-phosphate synthase enzyme